MGEGRLKSYKVLNSERPESSAKNIRGRQKIVKKNHARKNF